MTNNDKDLVEALRLQGWNEAADRIEQLERERDKAAAWAIEQHCCADSYALELGHTRAKLAKAVEELHFYADFYEAPNDGPWGVNSDDFGARARAVLAELEAGE